MSPTGLGVNMLSGPDCNKAHCCGIARVLAWYYISLLLVMLGICVGVYAHAEHMSPDRPPVAPGEITIARLSGGDAGSYLMIATSGYRYDPNRASVIAFFPVYPMLGRIVAWMIPLPMGVVLLIVSHVAFVAALILLY